MLSQLITNHKIQKDIPVKNLRALILALCAITTATKMYCQETPPLKSNLAEEIIYAKEHDPEIKTFLEMNTEPITTEFASILSSISKIKHVKKQQGIFNKAINKFFFIYFLHHTIKMLLATEVSFYSKNTKLLSFTPLLMN